MKTITLVRITIATILVAFSGGSALAQACVPVNPKLWIDKYRLELKEQQPICVTMPGEFEIRIHQPGNSSVAIDIGDVTVHEKAEGGPTIRGVNDPTVNKVVVSVGGDPNEYDPGDDFDFYIEVKGVGILDPRVRIVDTDTLAARKYRAIEELLDELFSMTIDEFRNLKPPRPPEDE
jgi:hypothetical protein